MNDDRTELAASESNSALPTILFGLATHSTKSDIIILEAHLLASIAMWSTRSSPLKARSRAVCINSLWFACVHGHDHTTMMVRQFMCKKIKLQLPIHYLKQAYALPPTAKQTKKLETSICNRILFAEVSAFPSLPLVRLCARPSSPTLSQRSVGFGISSFLGISAVRADGGGSALD